MPKLQAPVKPKQPARDRSVPKLPVKLADQDNGLGDSVAPSGRLKDNSVTINGHQYDVESLLAFLVSKVDHSA